MKKSEFLALKRLNTEAATSLITDLKYIQWSANDSNFKDLIQLLEMKYQNENIYSRQFVSACKEFFDYFEHTWVTSQENLWYEGSNPYQISNNQGIEGLNRHIKQSHTLRKKMPLCTFINVSLKMVSEWAMNGDKLLTVDRNHLLFEEGGLPLRTNGYEWFQNNKANQNYVKISGSCVETLIPDISAVWAVPSSNTRQHAKPLMELAKDRLKTRKDISSISSFDQYVSIRNSCHLVEQSDKNEFYCDCHEGIKSRMCKHTVGLMYKTNNLEVTSEVRSKPLGQKRKRGRPKQLPACLTKSPEPEKPANIGKPRHPMYRHHPSPDVSLLDLETPPPASSTLILDNSIPLSQTFTKSTEESEASVLDKTSSPNVVSRISRTGKRRAELSPSAPAAKRSALRPRTRGAEATLAPPTPAPPQAAVVVAPAASLESFTADSDLMEMALAVTSHLSAPAPAPVPTPVPAPTPAPAPAPPAPSRKVILKFNRRPVCVIKDLKRKKK